MKIADIGNPKRLWGGILPFIGWRKVNVDSEGHPCAERSGLIADAFEVEWFGFGAVLYIGAITPDHAADAVEIRIMVIHSKDGGELSYSRDMAVKQAQQQLLKHIKESVPLGRQCTVLSTRVRPDLGQAK